MTLHINDGGTWRTASSIHVKDAGGTWRTAQEVWINEGGAWRKAFGAAGPVSAFGGAMTALVVGGGAASATVTFNTDGSLSGSGTGLSINGAAGDLWYSPATSGIGSSYWIRATVTSGSMPTSGTTGAWLALSSARAWTYASGGSERTGTVLFEVASDSGGSTVVCSGSFTFTATEEA